MTLETIIPKRAAFSAWKAPLTGRDDKRQLVEAAILAANAHNAQAWRFEQADACILVGADQNRSLGSLDPFRREMHLSLGCAIENLAISAEAHGLCAEVEARPGKLPRDYPDDVAAVIRFTPASVRETRLFKAIPARHTNRGAYQIRAIPVDVLGALKAHAKTHPNLQLRFVTGIDKAALSRVIVRSTRDIIADRETARDNARWFRFRTGEIGAHRDGLTLDASASSAWKAFTGKLAPPSAAGANRSWLRDTGRVHLRTAPLLGIISVHDPWDRPSAIAAGRLWQRVHLELTAHGLTAQPLNQPLQRVDRERSLGEQEKTHAALTRVLGRNAWRPTLIFRAGYAVRPAFASPRRPVDEVIGAAGGEP